MPFTHFDGALLPFSDATFDGAFVNEVLEHVEDEHVALGEIHRVLKSGAHVVVISPNRWFPLEGHVVPRRRPLDHLPFGFPRPLAAQASDQDDDRGSQLLAIRVDP